MDINDTVVNILVFGVEVQSHLLLGVGKFLHHIPKDREGEVSRKEGGITLKENTDIKYQKDSKSK